MVFVVVVRVALNVQRVTDSLQVTESLSFEETAHVMPTMDSRPAALSFEAVSIVIVSSSVLGTTATSR